MIIRSSSSLSEVAARAARASFGVAGGGLMLFKIILHNIKVKFSRSSELYMAAALLMSCGLQAQYVH